MNQNNPERMNTTATHTTIFIPTPLRMYTDRQPKVEVEGKTVGEALANLISRFPSLKPHLYDEQGKLRAFVNVFRNDEDIRHLDREATSLRERDELSIVPSIAGGVMEPFM